VLHQQTRLLTGKYDIIVCLYILSIISILFIVAAPFHRVKFLYMQMHLLNKADANMLVSLLSWFIISVYILLLGTDYALNELAAGSRFSP
jgi:hypothetical protein